MLVLIDLVLLGNSHIHPKSPMSFFIATLVIWGYVCISNHVVMHRVYFERVGSRNPSII